MRFRDEFYTIEKWSRSGVVIKLAIGKLSVTDIGLDYRRSLSRKLSQESFIRLDRQRLQRRRRRQWKFVYLLLLKGCLRVRF